MDTPAEFSSWFPAFLRANALLCLLACVTYVDKWLAGFDLERLDDVQLQSELMRGVEYRKLEVVAMPGGLAYNGLEMD